MLAGNVTSDLTDGALEDVSVSVMPAVADAVMTDGSGDYSLELPVGYYEVTFSLDNYMDTAMTVSVLVGDATPDVDVVLEAVGTGVLEITVAEAGDLAPDGSKALSVEFTALDGATVAGIAWAQTAGVTVADIADETTATATVTFGDLEAFKAELAHALLEPNRTMVMGINPFALEEAEHVEIEVAVTDSNGVVYVDSVGLTVGIDLAWAAGTHNVPVGLPVFLQAEEGTAYAWTAKYDVAFGGSFASDVTLDSTTSRYPVFTPADEGWYKLEVAITTDDGALAHTLMIRAGEYSAGAIQGVETIDGVVRPVANTACTGCHDSMLEGMISQFDDWRMSGHAGIFTQNIDNPSGHWRTYCADCHTVGYNPAVDNGGWDEAAEADGWTPPSHGDIGTYEGMFTAAEDTAMLSNIQCENCHGPNGAGHAAMGELALDDAHSETRVSYSSDVCATCHGEPLRHARYQQWLGSGHGTQRYSSGERAVSGSCAKCHTAEGFVLWLSNIADGADPAEDLALEDMWWRRPLIVDGAQVLDDDGEDVYVGDANPISCVACHDPHTQGDKAYEPNTSTVRVAGNTLDLLGGFDGVGMGRGAICVTCHNTRRGNRGDAPLNSRYSGPHAGAEGDVFLGYNAYFVEEGQRSAHGNLGDTCATCHMEVTPPPEDLSYNLSGTNHTFTADPGICGSCHGDLDGAAFQANVENALHGLELYLVEYGGAKLDGMAFWIETDDGNVEVGAGDDVTDFHFGEYHGAMFIDIDVEGTHYSHLALSEIQLTEGGDAVFGTTNGFALALWNYMLVHADGSNGVHNPSYVWDVIEATLNADLDMDYEFDD